MPLPRFHLYSLMVGMSTFHPEKVWLDKQKRERSAVSYGLQFTHGGWLLVV